MNIQHHPGDSLLLAYGAGTLSDGFSLVVSSHSFKCAQCRKSITDAEMIGGVLLDQAEPIKMKHQELDSLLDCLDDDDFEDYSTLNYQKVQETEIPYPLLDYLSAPLDKLKWKFMAPGIRHFPLPVDTGSKGTVKMLKIDPGITVPFHSHNGMELSIVFRGSYHDETGTYCPYDVGDLDQDTSHQPVSDANEGCICLIATDTPLLYKGVLLRVLQKFSSV